LVGVLEVMEITKEATFYSLSKIAEQSGFILLSPEEWKSFTNKLWHLDLENKRLKKRLKKKGVKTK
jgi:hypothetical protein